jgi:hypothetical protein
MAGAAAARGAGIDGGRCRMAKCDKGGGTVRPKRKAKRKGARADSRMTTGERGTHRDLPGKQRRGESGGSTTNRADSERAEASSTLGNAKPMDIDSDLPADEGEGEAMHEGTRDGTESEEEDRGSEEAPAPTELARSLGQHRSALQQIRHRLHAHGSTRGITTSTVA